MLAVISITTAQTAPVSPLLATFTVVQYLTYNILGASQIHFRGVGLRVSSRIFTGTDLLYRMHAVIHSILCARMMLRLRGVYSQAEVATTISLTPWHQNNTRSSASTNLTSALPSYEARTETLPLKELNYVSSPSQR